MESCNELGLIQINNLLNDNDRILDLCWTNETDICECRQSSDNFLKNETHHKSLEIEIEFEYSTIKEIELEYYNDFKNANYENMMNDLNCIDWETILLDNESIESNTQNFYNMVQSTIYKHVERKQKKVSSHPCWYDKTAINLKNRVNRLHKKAKKKNSSQIRDNYNELRKKYRDHLKSIYHDYKMSIQQMIIDDPTNFYKHVNASKKQMNELPTSMCHGDRKADTPDGIAELFRSFFESVYTEPCIDSINEFNERSTNTSKMHDSCQIIPDITISEELIANCINDIPENLVMGPDNIPNIFIKKCAGAIVKPLTWLLKSSFEKQSIPSIWKKSYIRPIHKSGRIIRG